MLLAIGFRVILSIIYGNVVFCFARIASAYRVYKFAPLGGAKPSAAVGYKGGKVSRLRAACLSVYIYAAHIFWVPNFARKVVAGVQGVLPMHIGINL